MKTSFRQKIARILGALILVLSAALTLQGQPLEVTDGATAPYTPENLISNIFLGEGLDVLSVNFNGDPIAVGYFQDGIDEIGIDRGIVMTSGAVSSNMGNGVDNPGSTFASTNNAGGGGGVDADLVTIASPLAPFNVCKYEIEFIPFADTLRFNYVWASEEYPEYACSSFNDVFAFIISGPGINGPYENNGENIAIIPGTNLPVSINNLHPQNGPGCPPVNEQFYNNNNGSGNLPVYDGFTDVFTAEAVVIPCSTYTIKLLISDVGDGIFDSGVFLEAKSFGTGSVDVEIATLSLNGTISEGCSDASITFELPSPVETDFPLDYTIFGTAENGVDYTAIPLDLTIPAGDSSVTVFLEGFEDGIAEGIETIGIDIQADICNRDTFFLFIADNELIPPELGNDTTICQADTLQLDGTINVPLPPPPTFTNVNDVEIDPPFTNIFSPVNVFGVEPFELGPGVIQQVCINIDHNWLSDLDIFLVGPNGQFIELSTDNGSNGDDYINTCFVPGAVTPIDFIMPPASGAPYTGEFEIEGVWSDLWSGSENPTNGEWNLLVIDDANGFEGTLLDWSIVFEPAYQINYQWTPSDGLSCDDCPDPLASPDTTTTYILTAFDSYGCEVSDTITITVNNSLPAPDVSCGIITDSCITFTWPFIPGAVEYEVNVDGNGWEIANGLLSHTVCGLAYEQTVNIQVRAIDACNGFIGTATCTTPPCTGATVTVDNIIDASCNGGNDGAITIGATGGLPPLSFSLDTITNTTGVFTGLAAGTYEVTVTDAAPCPITVEVTVQEPPAIGLTPVESTPISCFGAGDGTITVQISGGTWPYDFNWDNGVTDSLNVNLGPADYPLTVTDANGCSSSVTVTLAEPDELLLNTSGTNILCNGDTTGSASVNVVGGVEPFTYTWDSAANNQDSSVAVNLGAGMYTIEVMDANGCTATADAEVTEFGPIVLGGSSTDVNCNGDTDGSATVVASGGGVGIFFYEWDANAGSQMSATATNLGVGTYTVTVSDLLGCADTISFSVAAPNAMVLSVQTDSVSCAGQSDGTGIVTVTGGTPGFSYTWIDGLTTPDSIRNDLPAGPQQVIVTDGNGCEETFNFEIGAPAAIGLTLDTSPVACNGGNDGTATVIPNGGTAPFDYLWSNNETTATGTGFQAGFATVTVTDANGCQSIDSIEVLEPEPITLTTDSTAALCFGEPTGSVTVVAVGGVGNYTYAWNDPAAQATATAVDLLAGTYSVTVTDQNNCESITQVTVNEPPLLEVTADFTALSCTGDPDGTATVTPTGGTQPYSYLWSDNQVTQTATGLDAASYTVTVTDANGCEAETSVTLTAPEQITLSTSTNDVLCFDGADGSANVQVLTGDGPFTYEWSDGQDTPTATGLTAGAYMVTVNGASGCTATASVLINEPGALSAQLEQGGSLCNNGDNGTAEVLQVAYGGVPADLNDFTYTWNTVPFQNGPIATGLTGGNSYTVTITDPNGCQLIQSIDIDNPDPVEATITSTTDASCADGADGTATAQGLGGVGPFSYQWSSQAGSQTTATATGLGAGTYTVEVIDANGCSIEISATIGEPEPLEVAFRTVEVDCFGGDNGEIEAIGGGGVGGFIYEWSTGETGTTIGALSAGTYTVTLSDANGCELIENVEVSQPDEPLLAEFSAVDVSCAGFRDGSITVNASGGTSPYRYSLDGINFIGSPQLLGLEADSYNVFVEDANGCVFLSSDIEITEPDPIVVDLGPDLEVDLGGSIQLNSTVINAQGTLFYEWFNINPPGLSCFDCPSPTTDSLFYPSTYQLVVVDENGCEGDDIINVRVRKVRDVVVPTGFSPNGDGQNDLLLVHGVSGTTITLFQVFDRWGELVFQTGDFPVNDPNVGWDGTFRGEEMNSGVFLWVVEALYPDGETKAFKGQTTLVR
jgi:gliding motility-associated-like protein